MSDLDDFVLNTDSAIPLKVASDFFVGLKQVGQLEGVRWAEGLKRALDEASGEVSPETPGPDPQIAGYKRLASAILSLDTAVEYFNAVAVQDQDRDFGPMGFDRHYELDCLVKDMMQKVMASGASPEIPPIEQPPALSDKALIKDYMNSKYEVIRTMLVGVISGEDEFSGLAISMRNALERLDRRINGHNAYLNRALNVKEAAEGAAEPQLQQNVVQEYPEQSIEAQAAQQALADAQQAQAESDYLRARLQQAEQMRKETAAQVSHQMQATAAAAEQQTQLLTQQLEEAQVQAAEAAQQVQMQEQAAAQAQLEAQQAQEQALMSEENAAVQAEAKMRVAMRVQQMRQALAELASQDVLAEEGMGSGQVAGPGSAAPVMTMTQQQAQVAPPEEVAAAAEQEAAAVEGAPTTPEAAKETEEAQRANQEADQQTQQAAQAQAQAQQQIAAAQ